MSSTTIGDGMVALALAGGIVGYVYIKYRDRQKRMEIIHQERMAAIDKGIPLPEFPLDTEQRPSDPGAAAVVPILGTVLFTLSVGAMIVLYLNLPTPSHSFWISPLPFAFLGIGLISFHFSRANPWR
jgi:hypothetical protein